MKADSTSAKVLMGLSIFLAALVLLGVGCFFSDNVDDYYWFNLIAGPITILGWLQASGLMREYIFRTVAPDNKVMRRLVGYGSFFVFCLIVFFWYAEDFQEGYFANVVRYSVVTTGGVFLLDCLSRLSERVKKKKFWATRP